MPARAPQEDQANKLVDLSMEGNGFTSVHTKVDDIQKQLDALAESVATQVSSLERLKQTVQTSVLVTSVSDLDRSVTDEHIESLEERLRALEKLQRYCTPPYRPSATLSHCFSTLSLDPVDVLPCDRGSRSYPLQPLLPFVCALSAGGRHLSQCLRSKDPGPSSTASYGYWNDPCFNV